MKTFDLGSYFCLLLKINFTAKNLIWSCWDAFVYIILNNNIINKNAVSDS